MKNFTKVMREQKMKSKNQLGMNMIGLIIWMVLAVAVMGGVTALFVSASQQTATGAEQNQQQQSILNALNRVSRDVSISNPIVYASSTEVVMDVKADDGTIQRRRYLLNLTDKKVWEYAKVLSQPGDPYDSSSIDAINNYWNSGTIRAASTVYSVDTDVAQNTTPFLKYYDSSGTAITGTINTSKNAEAIARVDISLTAKVSNKGNVSLSTSAVPRATTNLGATATPILAPCPAFTATLTGNTVVLRWDKASDDTTSYEITRNGVTIQPTTAVTDPTQLKYSFTDTPGVSSVVMNYMLKVVSPAGISNCIDSVRPIVIMPGATQLTTDLVPTTTVDGTGTPVSTAWTAPSDTTKVKLTWNKVDIATGYVIYRQKLDASGAPVGERTTEATLDAYPYVDLNSTTLAASQLTYTASANWDEYTEWTIKVLSRSGDNDQTPAVRSLAYPNPVASASISAVSVKTGDPNKVSNSDLAAGYGNTHITWTYNAGMNARGFDIYRSAMDTPTANFPAGFTKIGSVDAGISEFYDRKAELGSTYGYYVVAKNTSGFSNSYASMQVQQLQYPPDPVLAAVSVSGSRDFDGRNHLMWSTSKSATGYHIQRANIDASNILCLTAANCNVNSGGLPASATSYDDSKSDVSPATRFTYAAYSYNATGTSPELAAQVTLTQRPSVPTVNKTADPTLNSLVTSMTWNATAGSWCTPGAYSGMGNNCAYEEKQYANDGSVKYTDTAFATAYNWGNQDWGRHYTYTVRAQNAAITNGGWSDYSAKPAADTYPGPFSVANAKGDPWGNNSQRYIYTSSSIVTNTNETDHTRDFSGSAYTSIGWGTPAGVSTLFWERTSQGGGSNLTSANGPSLPSNSYMSGTVNASQNWATILAAPGSLYGAKVTATSLENSLTRAVSAPSNVWTPADMPQSGYMQMVCSGPWDATPAGYDQAAAISYAQRSFSQQSYGSRLQSLNRDPRYGFYTNTVIQGKYQNSSDIASNRWWQGPDGKWWFIEQMAKGSVGYYVNGNSASYNWQQGSSPANNMDGDNIGDATHRLYVGHGFTLYNTLSPDGAAHPELNSYWMFILMDEQATRGGCGNGVFQEPYDACYEWNAQSQCLQLNQNGTDGRPRWTTQ